MVWCTGKKSKKIANRTTIPGGGHITGRAPLILKSLLMLCWLSHSTMTSVLGWQYHAGYRSRETRWEATLRRRYCRLCKWLFRYLFLSNGVLVLNFWIIKRDCRPFLISSYLALRVFPQLSLVTSFSAFLISVLVITEFSHFVTGYRFRQLFFPYNMLCAEDFVT